jgi:predicted Zn-dependent protease
MKNISALTLEKEMDNKIICNLPTIISNRLAIAFILYFQVLLSPVSTNASSVEISEDPELYGVIRQIADPLLKQAGFDPAYHNIYIINSDTENAFTDVNQDVYVYKGLINLCNIDMIRAILAHEIGHISLFHIPEKISSNRQSMLINVASLALAAGAASMAPSRHQMGTFASIFSLGNMTARRQFLSHSRLHEVEADKAAINLLHNIGYSGKGLLEVFKSFQAKRELMIPESEILTYELTHPLDTKRYNLIKDQVESESKGNSSSGSNSVAAKLYGQVREKVKSINSYSRSGEKPGNLESDLHLKASFALYRQLPSQAMGACNELIEQYGTNPYYYYLRARAYVATAEFKKAYEDMRRATKLDEYSNILLELEKHSIALLYLGSLKDSKDKTAGSEADNAGPMPDRESKRLLSSTIGSLEKLRIDMRDSLYVHMVYPRLSKAYDIKGEEGKVDLNLARMSFDFDKTKAKTYAERALEKLPKDTPAYLAAEDIIEVIENDSDFFE